MSIVAPGDGNPMTNSVDSIIQQLPPNVGRSGFSFETVPANGPFQAADFLARQFQKPLGAQGGAGIVTSRGDITNAFRPLLPGSQMALIDTSETNTSDTRNDFVMEATLASTRWDHGEHLAFDMYMPIFTLASDIRYTSAGFQTLATPMLINQLQARLVQAGRNAAINNARPVYDDPRRLRARMLNTNNMYYGGSDEEELPFLEQNGSLTVDGLAQKIKYLGPITQVWSGNGSAPYSKYQDLQRGEQFVNYSFHSRGTIYQMFGEEVRRGDKLYFAVGSWSRSSLMQMGTPMGGSMSELLSKRGFDDGQSSWIGMSGRQTDNDDVVQVRGFSSRDGEHWLGDTTPLDSMKTDVADRLYDIREVRAAVDYVEWYYDDVDDMMKKKAQEPNLQEALELVPELVLEFYRAGCRRVFPVGTVRDAYSIAVSRADQLNAHWDYNATKALPTVEIYQNY